MSGIRAEEVSEKEMVTEEKEERGKEAEGGQGKTHSYSTTGVTGQPTGAHQMSALPGHGSGQPTGQVVEGVVPSHPIGKATGTQRPSAPHNTHVGGGVNKGYGTGGSYT